MKMPSLISTTIVISLSLLNWHHAAPAQDAEANSVQLTVLRQGVVHEAFATEIDYHARPAAPIDIAPPADPVEDKPAIAEELQKQAVWIPGYWRWNADEETFVWVRGIWRFPPPDRQWYEGKWSQTTDGYVRAPGAWLPASEIQSVSYVAQPPRYKGRFIDPHQLKEDQVWIPGCWIPREGEFTWREGFVSTGRTDFVWVPDHYTWTPEGWLFVSGYWDYPIKSRGQAFASILVPRQLYDQGPLRLTQAIPVPANAIQEVNSGEYVYQLSEDEVDTQLVFAGPGYTEVPLPPTAIATTFAPAADGSIRGIARKGELLAEGITIELIGSGTPPVETDEQGRFEFTDVPFGVYYLYAEGPVQNHLRRARTRLIVDEAVEEVELLLR